MNVTENHFEFLFENNPYPIWIVELKTLKFLEVNNAAISKYGYSRKEFLSMTLKDIRPKEDIPALIKQTRNLAKIKHRGSFLSAGTWKHNKKNGEIIYALVNTKYIQFHNKSAIFVIVNDITEKKLVEDKLAFHSHLLENISEGVIAIDNRYKVSYWNRGAEIMYGWKSSEVLGKDIRKYLKSTGPESEQKKIMIKLIKKGYLNAQIVHIRKDGKPITVEGSLFAMPGQENHVEGFLTINKNITDKVSMEHRLKENEKLYRNIVETAREGIGIANNYWEVFFVNQSLTKMLGYRMNEILGKPVDVFMFDEDKRAFNSFKIELEKGNRVRVSSKLKRKDGSPISCIFSLSPSFDLNGKFNGVLAMFTDITDLKNAEVELNAYNIKLRELTNYLQKVREDERYRISRDIHDHLGQLLNVLKVEVFVLAKKIASQRNEINKESALKELLSIQDLLDSSIKSVRKIVVDLRPEVLEKLGLIEAVTWLTEEFEKRTNIKCRLKFTSDAMLFTKDQSYTIYRILQETLSNVAKHSSATKVKIDMEKNNNFLKFSVSDNGIGINEKDLTKSKTYGIISIKERIYSLNGDIKISTNRKRGTKIEMRFPLSNKMLKEKYHNLETL